MCNVCFSAIYLIAQCEYHGSSEMTIINGCPVSKYVWHAKEPSLLNGHECRAGVNICSPSPVMVTSPGEWKIILSGTINHKETNVQKPFIHLCVKFTSFNYNVIWIIISFSRDGPIIFLAAYISINELDIRHKFQNSAYLIFNLTISIKK